MGCWNATCNISNLPIFAGDKIALIPLVKVREKAVYNCCYPTDNFFPFAFPIFGEYDEYGGVENAYTTEENKNHLLSLEYCYSDRDDESNPVFKKFEMPDTFDTFVSHVLCCHENGFVKMNNNIMFKSGYAEMNFMMIHYDLYRALIKEIGDRIPYDREDTFEHLLNHKFLEIAKNARTEYKNLEKMAKTAANDKMKACIETLKHDEVSKIMQNIFGRGMMLNTEKWRYFADLMINHPSTIEDVIDQATEMYLFTTALSFLRKGYLCDSGCGSQSQETRIHAILASFILTMVEKKTKELEEIDDEFVRDVQPGITETLFYFD